MLDYAALVGPGRRRARRAASSAPRRPSASRPRRCRSACGALEERVGAVLVLRGQPCLPTEAGAQLCAHVERVRLLEGEVAGLLPGLAGAGQDGPLTLRVAVNADSLGTWFMPAAAAFARDTGALLDLVLDAEEHTAGRLRGGEVLAAVTADPEPVQGCRTRPLGALRYVAAASPDGPRAWFPDGPTPRGPGGSTGAALRPAGPRSRPAGPARSPAWIWRPRPIGCPRPAASSTPAWRGSAGASIPLALVEGHLAAGRLVELAPGHRLDVPLHWQFARIGARAARRPHPCRRGGGAGEPRGALSAVPALPPLPPRATSAPCCPSPR